MKLIIQPDDGAQPLLEAINGAKKSVDIAIFRFDLPDVESALVEAVHRGVAVRALIAFTNRGGESKLRGLEMRLLGAGVVVARTNNDLVRYHGKYMIIDGKKLFVLAFNFSREDLRTTRSFGVSTDDEKLVKDAMKLFESDCCRQDYSVDSKSLLVSPVNSRERLTEYLSKAKKELLIYDLEVSDPAMLRILKEREEKGVEVRIIGRAKGIHVPSEVRASHPLRLHVRGIVRDQEYVFLGSQSLRRLELDSRREVGILLRDRRLAARVAKVFDEDWETAKADALPAEKLARKVAKAIAKELGPVAPVVEEVAAKHGATVEADADTIEDAVKDAVKLAVRDAIQQSVGQAVLAK